MTVPGPDVPGPDGPAAQSPAPQGQPPMGQPPMGPPPQGPPPPAEQGTSSKKKWLGIAGGLVAAGVVGVSAFGLFGAGASEVGDCIKTTSDNEYETVDCGSDEAEFKIVGIDDQEMTYKDFEESNDICLDFAEETEYALWEGEMVTEPGTIYCAGPV